jgi:hypothetical protein
MSWCRDPWWERLGEVTGLVKGLGDGVVVVVDPARASKGDEVVVIQGIEVVF